jgi:OmpA-OmpF porin, OOP family
LKKILQRGISYESLIFTDVTKKLRRENMKKVFMSIAILMLTLFVATGYAQVRAGSFTVSPTIGGYKFEGNEDMKTSISLGLRAGYNFTKYIGVEGFFHYVPTEIIGESQFGTNIPVIIGKDESMSFLGYGIEGLFHILPDGKLVPFLAAGVGGVHYSTAYERTTEDKHNKIALDYGAGLKYFLTENIALRGDVRHVIPLNDTHNNLLYTVGLSFAFGGAKKVVESAPAPVAPPPPPVVAPPPPPPAPPIVEEVKPQAAAAPEIMEKGRITLNVLFDFDKAIIKKNSFNDVDNLVAVMKQYPDLNVIIEGHTCTVGSAAYNKKLSQRRADAVKKYMVEKGGIDAKRLTAKGFGFEKPIASNKTEAGRIKNRRVEAATIDYIIKK